MSLLELTPAGIYCGEGRFYIDPWLPVERAAVTHAHADHARPGSGTYLTTETGRSLLRTRLADESLIEAMPYGETRMIGPVRVSFHPAGHILGSAQVRCERNGEVWVVSGDYKVAPDTTSAPFEPLRCHTFVTESTFGLPLYRWLPAAEVAGSIHDWWQANAAQRRSSLLFAYPLGKAQRVMASLNPGIGPILVHGAVDRYCRIYQEAGVDLPPWRHAADAGREELGRALVIAPPSALGTAWTRRFVPFSSAMASGWMQIRGTRRRLAVDRGFVLSDHADWLGLNGAVEATGAETVWVTHGYRTVFARWLAEKGLRTEVVETRFEGDREEPEVSA